MVRVQIPDGFSLIWVKHRHGRHQATPQIALLEGWGELRGAIATSYSHDSHNLVVLGTAMPTRWRWRQTA